MTLDSRAKKWRMDVIRYVLYANAAWDMGSAAAIAGNCRVIARWHTEIWLDESNNTNTAARTLMAWLLVTFGLARWAAAMDPPVYLVCGMVSYVIEGLCVLISTSNRLMKPLEGLFIALSSFALAFWMMKAN